MSTAVKLIVLVFAALVFGCGPGLSDASKPAAWRYNAHSQELPFARSERAQSVWASRQCWSECGSYCTWGMAGCLKQDAQGHCLKLTDKCDRYCQRECRTWGGPLLPVEFPWE
jgi:hypothetical protein